MALVDISEQDAYLLKIAHEARPFEVVEIHKDKAGIPNSYLIKRSQKILVSELTILEVK